MPRSRSRSPSSPLATFLLGGVAVLGLVSLGMGLYQVWSPPARPAVVPIVHDDPAPAPLGPPVKPGTVDLSRAGPDDSDKRAARRDGVVCPGCDIVVITVCSLRQDFVSAYGEHPGLTPSIDRIGSGGFVFERAYAASNFTLAGLTAVLTGRFGSSTGVLGWDKGLPDGIPTLPEVLSIYDYTTGAFTIDAPSGFRPDYGLDRGFQHMKVILPPRDTPDGRFRDGVVGEGGASATPVVEWIGQQPTDRPIFAMFHSRTAHFPFVVEPDYAGADPTGIWQGLWDAGRVSRPAASGKAMPGMAGGTAQSGVVELQGGKDPLQVMVEEQGQPAVESWRARYAEAVARTDRDIARVFDALEERGTLDRTIVVLVADHGESLYDHLELLHGDAYWDTVVRVPLLMRVPGLDGQAEHLGALVSHVDLMPTLLELVGAVPPADIDGRSLVPLLTGEAEVVREIALVEGGVAKHDASTLKGAVVAPPWMLVRQDRGCGGLTHLDPPRKPGEPASCLYHLDDDPSQTRNLARDNGPLVDALTARWQAFRDARSRDGVQLELDPAFVAELRANGYDFDRGAPE